MSEENKMNIQDVIRLIICASIEHDESLPMSIEDVNNIVFDDSKDEYKHDQAEWYANTGVNEMTRAILDHAHDQSCEQTVSTIVDTVRLTTLLVLDMIDAGQIVMEEGEQDRA